MIAGAILLAVAVLLGIVWLSFRLGWWDVSDSTLWQRYGDGSRTVDVDGVRIRMRDVGSGPAVLLLHGAFANLNVWRSWEEGLVTRGFRVVTMDGPPEGLSDFDAAGHGHQRLAELASQLADALGIDRFAIGGTSRGGAAALVCAGENPARITHLILTMVPVFNYAMPAFPPMLRTAQKVTRYLLSGYRPRFYWWNYLDNLFDDKAKLTPAIVREFTDFSNRRGHQRTLKAIQAPGASRDRVRNQALASAVTCPVLVLATPHDNALDIEHQRELASWFDRASCTFTALSRGGHFPSLEFGSETGTLVADFLQGRPPPPLVQV